MPRASRHSLPDKLICSTIVSLEFYLLTLSASLHLQQNLHHLVCSQIQVENVYSLNAVSTNKL